MRKKVCFLMLGSFILSTPSFAMEKSNFIPENSGTSHSKVNQIRQHYNLLPSSTYSIPSTLKTGLTVELFGPQIPAIFTSGTLDLLTIDFYQVLKENPLTPLEIDNFLPFDKWEEFLQTVQEAGSKIKVNQKGILSTDEENDLSVEALLQQQARWQFAKVFMNTLQQALEVIPASLYQYCPASLIVDQQFSPNDGPYELALKYERLGLVIKDLEDKISPSTRHFLMAEAFGKAADYFFVVANQVTDPFAKPDLYFSSGICFGWSAMHCESGKVEPTLIKGRGSMQQGYKSLSVAYGTHRQLMVKMGEGEIIDPAYTLEELIAIKEQLATYPKVLLDWSRQYDPDFYSTLGKQVVKTAPSSSS